jgi:hypothetical protein
VTAHRENRWLGVGESRAVDAPTAGREAATAALRGDDARLAVVFASDAYDLPELIAAIRGTLGDGVRLIGCSTAGEISGGGPGDAGVVLTCFGGSGFSVATARATGASADLRGAGAQAAACLADVEPSEHRVLMLLTDGLAGDQQEIVRGAHSVAGGGVPLVGGCAGDDLRMERTRQFFDDEILDDAVVAAAISSDGPLGIGVRHGWRPVGEPMLVTSSDGNRVFELDDRPALDMYLERLGVHEEVRTDATAFTRFALTHPLGLSGRGDEHHVRFIGEADFDDRSLGCIAAVPQGGLVWLMEGDAGSVLDATDAACADALAPLGGDAPLGLFAFDCIARRGILGDDGIRTEVERIARTGDGAPVAGFYTYGEIARTRGTSGFHNQTLVVLAVG